MTFAKAAVLSVIGVSGTAMYDSRIECSCCENGCQWSARCPIMAILGLLPHFGTSTPCLLADPTPRPAGASKAVGGGEWRGGNTGPGGMGQGGCVRGGSGSNSILQGVYLLVVAGRSAAPGKSTSRRKRQKLATGILRHCTAKPGGSADW